MGENTEKKNQGILSVRKSGNLVFITPVSEQEWPSGRILSLSIISQIMLQLINCCWLELSI